MMSQTGIVKTANIEDLAQICEPEILGVLLNQPAPDAALSCLEDHDFNWHFKKAQSKGRLIFLWNEVSAIEGLVAFKHQTEALKDIYCQVVGVVDSHILFGVFEPGFIAGDHIWHRDLHENVAGLVTYNPQSQSAGGFFRYADRTEEQYFKARRDELELSCLKEGVGQDTPHGQLMLIQHGAAGLIHKAQHVTQGVRVRTMFTPKI